MAEHRQRGRFKVSSWICWLLTLAVFLTVSGTASAAVSNPIPDGWYVIVSGNSNDRVLDIHNYSQANGGNLEIYKRNDTPNQIFYLKYRGDGYYTIQARHSSKYLHKANGGNTDDIHQWEGYGAANTLWKLSSAGKGYYYVESKCGNYMDNSGARTTLGNNVYTYPFNGTDAQKWKFVSVSSPSVSTNPFDKATINASVSKTKATSSSLPSGSTSFNQGDRVFFNVSLNNIKISKTELYVTPPGGSKTLVETDNNSYSTYIWMAGSNSGYSLNKEGTYYYTLRLYSGNYSKDISGSFSSVSPDPFLKGVIRTNVSKTKASYSGLPSGSTTFTQGDRVFFNAAVSNITITRTELYVTPPGGSKTLVESDGHSYSVYNWMAGSSSGYTLSKSGTYKYILRFYAGNYSREYSGSITVVQPDPFPSATIRRSVSKTKATSSSLPSGSTTFTQGDQVYFNVAVSNITIRKTELYVTPPGGSKTLVETDSRSYTSYNWMAGSGSGYTLSRVGTYNYVLRLYSGNYSREYSGSITVVPPDPFPSATIKTNVSKTKANSSSLPSGSTSFIRGNQVFFNVSVKNITITKTELYVTPPGGSKTLVETDSHSYSAYNWMAGSGSGYTLSKSGTYNYVLRLYSGTYSRSYSGSITVIPPDPFPGATIKTNVSKTKANSSSLPSGSTSFIRGNQVFFNVSVKNITITKTELYVTPPGGSKTLVETDSHSYSAYNWMAGSGSGYTLSRSGTYNYVLRLYSGAYSRNYSGSFTVIPPDPFPNATIRTGVSKTKITSSIMPSASTSFVQGDNVFFNTTLSNITITKTELYITPPGDSQILVERDNNSYTSYIWMAGSSGGYTLSKIGTYKYVLRLYSGSYYRDYPGSITAVSPNPFLRATIRTNVSKTKITSNILPSGSTSFNQGDRVFFNTTLSNIKITKTELYITPPGGSKTLVERDNNSYTRYIWMAGSNSGYTLSREGTYKYELRLYSGGYSRTYTGSITAINPDPFARATIRTNVSKTKITSGILPSGSTSFNQGDRVFFNTTLSNIKITKTELYITPPGGSQTLVERDNSSYTSYIWMAGSSGGYTLSKEGTYKYVLRLYSGSYSRSYSGTITAVNPNPFARATIKTNISKTKITSNSLPAGSTSFSQGNRIFFNISVSNITISKTELYVTPPGGSQTLVEADNHSYTSFNWMAGSSSGYSLTRSGSYKYVLRLYSGGYSKTYSGSFTVAAPSPFLKATISTNVSTSKVTSDTLPPGSTSFARGDQVFFNAAFKNITITKTELYITPPGGSKTLVERDNNSYTTYVWMAGSSKGYSLNKYGTYDYELRLYSGNYYKTYSGSISVTYKGGLTILQPSIIEIPLTINLK